MKFANNFASIANDEKLKVNDIDNINIRLINDKILIFIDIKYISKLQINFINTSRLHHKNFNLLYSINEFCNICNKNTKIDLIDMINDQYIFQTISKFKNMKFNELISFSISKLKIFVFAKSINDIQI